MFITTPAKAIFDHDSTTRDLAEIDSGLALSSSLECFTCGQPHRARWEEISVMPELGSRHLFTITMKLPPTLDLGDTPAGNRRVFTVSSGEFTGDRLRGEVLPQAGSDLLLLRADRSNQQDVRLLLRTEDSALILMTYRGV